MDEISEGLKVFFDHWFAGFSNGVEALDESACKTLLHACGKACAQSYTVQIFRDVKNHSEDLDVFLRNLMQRVADARYERTGPNTIRVTYERCGCDLVRLGWVQTAALCECSAANLRENLEQSLNVPISVEIESSILRGENQCVFVATFENMDYI